MRFSHFLLVTATVLLASGNVTAVSGHTSADSTMVSPDLVVSLRMGQATGVEKRFLRNYNDEGDEDEKVDDEEEEEERADGTNLFSPEKLSKMLDSSFYRSKRFKKWKSYGYTPIKVQDEVSDKLYQKYKQWYYHGPGAARN